VPDHPWVDTAKGAAGKHPGELRTATAEEPHNDGSSVVTFAAQTGLIAADLTAGADVSGAVPLKANEGLSTPRVKLHGSGFIVAPEKAVALGLGAVPGLEEYIRDYRHGKDLNDTPRCVMVIDLHGLAVEEVRQRFPAVYQHVLTTVKPERDHNNEAYRRENWWLFGRKNTELRAALRGLPRYIATAETSKHRMFQFLDASIRPDNMLIVIGLNDAFYLGILSSRIHVVFSLAAGGRLGVGNDPRYNKTRCFDPFPFPACDEAAKARIRALGEELDAHRKRVQAQHPGLSLTALYNVLTKLRAGSGDPGAGSAKHGAGSAEQGRPSGAPKASGSELPAPSFLTPKERLIHDQGLVSVLRQLHDELDAAVATAYGWVRAGRAETDLSDAEILARLVALNAERAAEEARGHIRWLRPEYQSREPGARSREQASQEQMKLPAGSGSKSRAPRSQPPKQPWPKPLADRVRAVEHALQAAGQPVTAAALAKQFTRAPRADLTEIVEPLVSLGRAHREGEKFST
jgi:hypothetical protein